MTCRYPVPSWATYKENWGRPMRFLWFSTSMIQRYRRYPKSYTISVNLRHTDWRNRIHMDRQRWYVVQRSFVITTTVEITKLYQWVKVMCKIQSLKHTKVSTKKERKYRIWNMFNVKNYVELIWIVALHCLKKKLLNS